MTENFPREQVWSVGGQSVTGASHVRHNIPNQDAIAWAPHEGASQSAVLALSDGHGARLHSRSGTGAHIAVEIAIAVLSEAAADASWIAAGDKSVAARLVRDIIGRWQSAVISDLAARPMEKPAASYEERFLPYGATLIAAVVAPEGVFVLQLGDGDLLLGTADAVVWRPFAADTGLQGEQTYSLCLPDAEQRTRTSIFPANRTIIDFVMLSTDGLQKSFANDAAFVRHASAWRILLAGHGLAAVTEKLERWLVGATRFGNGDDVTLGFITRHGASGAAGRAPADFKLLPKEAAAPASKPPSALAAGLSGVGVAVMALAGFLLARVLW